jgi:CMP-N,N'-diacetyllegionaminic acid synthase
MINDKKILSVIPARGGSKGIKLKNLRKVNGKELVSKAIEISLQVQEIDHTVVSTDHDDIAEAAIKEGIDVPFRRPDSLSGDRVSDYDVLLHALHESERIYSTTFDIIIMLQPTSPLRTVLNITDALSMLVESSFDSVWSVTETDSKAHPFKQLRVSENNDLSYYDIKGKEIIARQQLNPVYHRNGVVYAISRSCLVSQGDIFGERCGALVIEGDNHISIDTEWDLKLVNLIQSGELNKSI